jgi:hypothetical protein
MAIPPNGARWIIKIATIMTIKDLIWYLALDDFILLALHPAIRFIYQSTGCELVGDRLIKPR